MVTPTHRCAICNATGSLVLTREGLRCGPCLRGENEIMRTWLRTLAEAHAADPGYLGDLAREALQMLDGTKTSA